MLRRNLFFIIGIKMIVKLRGDNILGRIVKYQLRTSPFDTFHPQIAMTLKFSLTLNCHTAIETTEFCDEQINLLMWYEDIASVRKYSVCENSRACYDHTYHPLFDNFGIFVPIVETEYLHILTRNIATHTSYPVLIKPPGRMEIPIYSRRERKGNYVSSDGV